MKALKWLLASVIPILLYGCIPMINPLYTEQDLILAPEIEGMWYAEDEYIGTDSATIEVWNFDLEKGKHYILKHVSKGHEAEFDARFVRFNGTLFLDLYPEKIDNENYLYEVHVYPMHTVSRLTLKEDILFLQMLDGEWVDKQIKNETLDVEFAKGPHQTVLFTDQTPKLQEFFSSIAKNDDAWGDALELMSK